MKIREIRVVNDVKMLEMTLVDNTPGEAGIVVSHLGFGSARRAKMLVGDVIHYINGVKVTSHGQAFDVMRSCTCRDLIFSLVGTPRKLEIDKTQPGKLEITLANRTKGRSGVEVEKVGVMGLAAAAGIAVGDIVLSINGSLVNDHASAIVMLDSSERFIELVVGERCDEHDDMPQFYESDVPSGGGSAYRLWGDDSLHLTGI